MFNGVLNVRILDFLRSLGPNNATRVAVTAFLALGIWGIICLGVFVGNTPTRAQAASYRVITIKFSTGQKVVLDCFGAVNMDCTQQ